MQRYDLDQCETKLKLLFFERAHLKIVKKFTGQEFYKCSFSKKPVQTDATLLDVTCCVRLHACCLLLRDLRSTSCCIRLHTTATRTQQHATLLAPQCWEFLRPFARSLKQPGQ